MMRSFITEFENEIICGIPFKPMPFISVTGISAAPYISSLVERAKEIYPEVRGEVISIRNDFFGNTINVAGLVTGKDIFSQLDCSQVVVRVLIPRNMLRHGECVFLDDITLEDISNRYGVPVRVVEQDGADFARAVCGA